MSICELMRPEVGGPQLSLPLLMLPEQQVEELQLGGGGLEKAYDGLPLPEW